MKTRPLDGTYPVRSYREDMDRLFYDPPKERGDGHTYVVHQIVTGEYLRQDHMEGTMGWVNSLEKAKRFYDGQAAWAAARRSIYPAEVLILEE